MRTRLFKASERLLLIATAVICILSACQQQFPPFPEGSWQSMQGRACVKFETDSCGNHTAVVFHRLKDGRTCPVTYPVCRTHYGYYIQAEGRIFILYDKKKNRLFLSPGGDYYRAIY